MVAMVKFGFSSSTNFHAAFSAKVLLATVFLANAGIWTRHAQTYLDSLLMHSPKLLKY